MCPRVSQQNPSLSNRNISRCDPDLEHIKSQDCPQKCSCFYQDQANNSVKVEMGQDHCLNPLNPVHLNTTEKADGGGGDTTLVLSITLPLLALLLLFLVLGRIK